MVAHHNDVSPGTVVWAGGHLLSSAMYLQAGAVLLW